MLNPILYTEKVLSDFLRYQLTAYAFADADLYAQMRRLLNLEETRHSPLLKGPYISLSKSFRKGASVADLVAAGVLHPHCRQLIPFPNVYGHQESAFRRIAEGGTTLVSTGTGSGKTECFLIPIISHCLKLRDEGAKPGVVAVVLYPMNALAEDQLSRLRELLAGSGITFGMYVGKTPEGLKDVSGVCLPQGASSEDYRKAVEQARAKGETYAIHPPEERVSREQMRTPGEQPNILLTNAKQLELLLTRQRDIELFDGAQLDFLVADEAHTFRGAAGAETACLIRRLRSFCGRDARGTACIATSATLVDLEHGAEAGRDFAARFFGVEPDSVSLVAEEYEPDLWAEKRYIVPPILPGDARGHLKNVLEAVERGDEAGPLVRIAYRSMTNRSIAEKDWQNSLFDELAQNEVVYQIAMVLERPSLLDSLLETLKERIGRFISEEELLAWLALGAAARKNGRPLLRPVVHVFVKGVEGAVVTFPERDSKLHLWLSAEDALEGKETAEHYPLPVMACTTCGQHYFYHTVKDFEFCSVRPGGGDADGEGRFWQPLEEKHGGRRVVLLDRLITDETEEIAEAESAEKGMPDRRKNKPVEAAGGDVPRSCAEVWLCRACGAIQDRQSERCAHCGREGRKVRLLAVRQKTKNPGWLASCISCGALGRQRPGGFREPARPVRALTVSDVHVLAQNMLQQAERKRLLVFADSRQDAAFQAGWMKDHARRFRLRGIIHEKLQAGAVGVGDLVSRLLDEFDHDEDLSQSLAPEVWRVENKSNSPLAHREQLKLFIRIQVLRELTTGVKQRIGLEPWGRLRVSYAGLTPEARFVQEWAAHLSLDPPRLVDGIAALLDIFRRKMLLLDPEIHLFDKYRDEGDFLVQRGYVPKLPGVPKGLKLRRAADDEEGRVDQLLSDRGDTLPRQAARRWGVPQDEVEGFIEDLWKCLTDELQLLTPVTLSGSRGNALPHCSGVRQIDGNKLILELNKGVWRCATCRRIHLRPTPNDACMAWRCSGSLQFDQEKSDDYNLMVLDERFEMLRPREHSAQVPAVEREFIERQFKSDDGHLNTLVCTPTLELGVDIGSLDSVLMRNVPPLPSNYWQRVGRAGRRHRLAVNLTYARSVSHDRAYFHDPLKLLDGQVTPPRFNMRNEVLVRKHVHSAALTALYGLARETSPLAKDDRDELADNLHICFPRQVRDYLFNAHGDIQSHPLDVSCLATMLSKHGGLVLPKILAAFHQGWPSADAAIVEESVIERHVTGTARELAEVLNSLWRRLQWALAQLRRLDEERRHKGTLDPDQDSLHRRCDRFVKKLKGVESRRRREAEGHDDTNSYAVLASEGFLPGYGLETGSVKGWAMGSMPSGFSDFELPRPSAMALREYAPGNLIYANGSKFYPRYYHLDPQGAREVVRLMVDVPNEAVAEIGMDASMSGAPASAGLGAVSLRAVPICDVDLPQASQISDEDDYRFQMSVAVYGREQGRHGEGKAFNWGVRQVHLRRNVHLRLINVGEAKLVLGGTLGYPLCLVCGQSRSPLASQRDRDEFAKHHEENCRQKMEPTGFFADIIADALSFAGCMDREEGYSIAEAIRTGAASVLEMELDDLQIVSAGVAGATEVDVLLYDPMPGGSGLLDQLMERWPEVIAAAWEVVEKCPSNCATACPDCLQTYRNAHTHKYLNRHVAIDRLKSWGDKLVYSHLIPPKQAVSSAEATGTQPVNNAEDSLKAMLLRAGFTEPTAQKSILLGKPYGSTTPDFFFDPPNDMSEGICIYLDGMSRLLHGDPDRAEIDRQIRTLLESRGYDVLTIPRGHLDDRNAMAGHFRWLGRKLHGRQWAEKIGLNDSWWEN
jgi:ATP-dependent helicase YprA (DUF1998 family)/rubrerythrin